MRPLGGEICHFWWWILTQICGDYSKHLWLEIWEEICHNFAHRQGGPHVYYAKITVPQWCTCQKMLAILDFWENGKTNVLFRCFSASKPPGRLIFLCGWLLHEVLRANFSFQIWQPSWIFEKMAIFSCLSALRPPRRLVMYCHLQECTVLYCNVQYCTVL